MNWSKVKLIFQREVRDQLRDRRTLFMIAVLPLLLYPLLGMSFFQLAQFMREHETDVLVLGAPEVHDLADLPPLFDDERFATELFSNPEKVDLLELTFAPRLTASDPPLRESEDEISDAEARLALQQGDFQVIVSFPPDFAERLKQFRARLHEQAAERPDGDAVQVPSPKIYYNTASEKSQIAYARVSHVLENWAYAVGQQNLRDSHVPVLAARPFEFEMSDVAGAGHRDAAVWSKVLPFVLLIWALTGAFYPAIDLCAGEKERGTLETLLSSPAERSEIVWGKLLTIMLFSVATAGLNLLSMGLTGTFVISQLNVSMLGSGGGLSMPPPSALLWLAAALLPVAALFSALCLALAAFARSTKEGQYYLMPLVLICMPLMILPMAPGVELNLGNSLIPVTGVVLLLRTVLEGKYLAALPFIAPVVIVTIACCLLAIRWAIDQFNKESVLFRESERLDLGLWMRHLVRDRRDTPSIAEALSCFVLILLVQFFMNLSLPVPRNFRDVATLIFINQVVVIALPALLMTIMLTRRPAQTLLLNRWPHWLSVPVVVLLAVALHPMLHSLGLLVQQLYPVSDDMIAQLEAVSGLLNQSPNAWLLFVLIALLPALCEEVAFRGFILSGLRHIGHKWWAIGLTAVFFGVAHGILQQSLLAALTGAIIGFIAVQTGSLVTCILFHATHNGAALLISSIDMAPLLQKYPALQWLITPNETSFTYDWPLVVGGAALAVLLLTWLHRLPYQQSDEEALQEALDHQSAHAPAS